MEINKKDLIKEKKNVYASTSIGNFIYYYRLFINIYFFFC